MSFAAKYPGVCAYGDRIEPGELVEYVGCYQGLNR